MTTKKISSLKLPIPNYGLDIGYINIDENKPDCTQWIPSFSHLTQLIEVRETGCTNPNQISESWKTLIYPSIVIEDARPELFLRRDFISKFVDTGSIYISNDLSGKKVPVYQMCAKGKVLSITLNEKQYRRFGLVAKKVNRTPHNPVKTYRVDVSLDDVRIKNSNKYQDKLVQAMKRLEPVGKIYFRYIPKDRVEQYESKYSEICLDYFQSVIDEYAMDGFKPVPLTRCSLSHQKLERNWINCSQSHPDLSLKCIQGKFLNDCGLHRDTESLRKLMDIVDWLGFQLLSIDCDKEEILSGYFANLNSLEEASEKERSNRERYDVVCSQVRGVIDYNQLTMNLAKIFKDDSDYVIFRALILNGSRGNSMTTSSTIMLLQDCTLGSLDVNSVTVIGLSGEA